MAEHIITIRGENIVSSNKESYGESLLKTMPKPKEEFFKKVSAFSVGSAKFLQSGGKSLAQNQLGQVAKAIPIAGSVIAIAAAVISITDKIISTTNVFVSGYTGDYSGEFEYNNFKKGLSWVYKPISNILEQQKSLMEQHRNNIANREQMSLLGNSQLNSWLGYNND